MNQEYYIKLFEELDNAVYEKVLNFLIKEKFTIKGFRDIRKISRKQLVRGLKQNKTMMNKTLFFIRDLYQITETMQEEMGEMNVSIYDYDLEEMLERHPEKRFGILAGILSMDSEFSNKIVMPQVLSHLKEEDESLVDVQEEEIDCEELQNYMIEEMLKIEHKDSSDEESESNKSQKPDDEEKKSKDRDEQERKAEIMAEQEELAKIREEYQQEKEKNKKLTQKYKSQKLDLHMSQEKVAKYESEIQKSRQRTDKLMETLTALQREVSEAKEKNQELNEEISKMREIYERPQILCIGFKRNLSLYTLKYQFTVLEEEEVEKKDLKMEQYEQIWLVDNEVASLTLKMRLRKKAKESDIHIHTFFGELDLKNYIKREVM